MKLLDRTREGPKLTDAGRVLVTHAEAAIARLDEAERELAAIAGLEGGELRLASFPSASATVLTEAVSVFHRRHPKVAAERRRRRARGVAAAAARRRARPRADLRLPVGPRGRGARSRPHPRADRVDARGAAEGPPARRAPGRPADRARRRRSGSADSRPSSCGEVVIRACRDAGFEPQDRLRVRRLPRHAGLHLRRARGHAAARPGAADAALGPRRPGHRPAGPKRRVWAATRAEGARSPATDEMLAILVEVGEAFAARSAERLELVA